MNTLNIGEKISVLRKKKKVTQEELAKYVGVSVQAVSKWECGGTPDIELLTKIADFFNISLDDLFNRDFIKAEDIELNIIQAINELPNNLRFNKIMDFCWAMQQGFIFHLYEKDQKFQEFNEIVSETCDSKNIYSRAIYNEGITHMRLGKSLSYFFAIPESQYGFTDKLGYKKDFIELFSFLSNENALKAFYFLNTQNEEFTTEILVENLKISYTEANNIINNLEKYKLISKYYENNSNELKYMFKPNSTFIALLTMTNEIIDTSQSYGYWEIANFRNEPFFKTPSHFPYYML